MRPAKARHLAHIQDIKKAVPELAQYPDLLIQCLWEYWSNLECYCGIWEDPFEEKLTEFKQWLEEEEAR